MHSVLQLIIFLQIEHIKMSTIKNGEHLRVKQCGENIFYIIAIYGYSECRIQPHQILALTHAEYNISVLKDTKKWQYLRRMNELRSWFQR